MEALTAKYPDSPKAELERFLHNAGGDASKATKLLDAHLKWRKESLPLPKSALRFGLGLPPWVLYMDGVTAIDGSTIVFCAGALINEKAGDAMAYAMAAAELLDSRLPRDSTEKYTILIDAKGIKNGNNPKVQTIVPYLNKLASVLGANFPGRLASLVVYPVPAAAEMLFKGVKMFMDAETASKVKLLGADLSGEAAVRYPPALTEIVDVEAMKSTPAAPLFACGGMHNPEKPLTQEAVFELCLSGYGQPKPA